MRIYKGVYVQRRALLKRRPCLEGGPLSYLRWTCGSLRAARFLPRAAAASAGDSHFASLAPLPRTHKTALPLSLSFSLPTASSSRSSRSSASRPTTDRPLTALTDRSTGWLVDRSIDDERLPTCLNHHGRRAAGDAVTPTRVKATRPNVFAALLLSSPLPFFKQSRDLSSTFLI